jgi:hypothetical protein
MSASENLQTGQGIEVLREPGKSLSNMRSAKVDDGGDPRADETGKVGNERPRSRKGVERRKEDEMTRKRETSRYVA